MDREEIKDFKFIMKVLKRGKEKEIDVPKLENLEIRIIDQIEIRKLKREVSILKKLEYGLVVGIFLLFILFFPRGMQNGIKSSYPTNTSTSSSIEDVVSEVQQEISSYLDEEYELNSLSLESSVLDYEQTY